MHAFICQSAKYVYGLKNHQILRNFETGKKSMLSEVSSKISDALDGE